MAITPENTGQLNGLSDRFRSVQRGLTSAFIGADDAASTATSADIQFLAGQSTKKFTDLADKNFDAFVGQQLIFGQAVNDKLRILTSNAAGLSAMMQSQSQKKSKKEAPRHISAQSLLSCKMISTMQHSSANQQNKV